MEKLETQQLPHQSQTEEPSDDEQLLPQVASKPSWIGLLLYHYNGFWCPQSYFPNLISFLRHFEAKDTDIILSTMPKSGTTWLKALIFSIINRYKYPVLQSPLLTTNPHALIPFFEIDIYKPHKNQNLEDMPCPRIFATHIHFNSLPKSILDSKCRIVYICRNPLDQFISQWHFVAGFKTVNESRQFETLGGSSTDVMSPPSIDDAFELFCQGVQGFGPFWDHVLGYWNASLTHPDKVLFLKYEDLKKDPMFEVKKIAEFIGCGFSVEEERSGLVEEIIKLCSFENLKNLEANKKGESHIPNVKNSSFFRKGKIGDWKNYLTPTMAERGLKVIKEKFGDSGLEFEFVLS